MEIKVKREHNRLDSLLPITMELDGEAAGKIRIGEEKIVALPAEKSQMTVVPVFEKVKSVQVADGDIVLLKRRTIHYILQFIALLLAISPGVMMAINIETWPLIIFFIIAIGIVAVIDIIIKTYHLEVTGNFKKGQGSAASR